MSTYTIGKRTSTRQRLIDNELAEAGLAATSLGPSERPENGAVGTRLLDVSVVLPCLNEEGSVGSCVTEALGAIARAGWRGEVVVVDNGSEDRSGAVALAACARERRDTGLRGRHPERYPFGTGLGDRNGRCRLYVPARRAGQGRRAGA